MKAIFTVMAPGAIGLMIGYEYVESVARLVEHVEVLVDADDKLTEERIAQDKASWEFTHINALIEKCKKGKEGGPPSGKEPVEPKPPTGKKGKKEPAPKEPTPTPKPGEPTTPTPPGESGEPGGEEPPTKPPVVEPPQPPAKPRGGTVGLPIDCGCKDANTAEWKSEDNGLAAIAASLGLLKQCAEAYEGELERFHADSAAIAQTMSAIETAHGTPGAKGFEMFREAAPGLGAAKTSLEKLAKASEEFSSTLRGCDKKVPEAVGIMNKAG